MLVYATIAGVGFVVLAASYLLGGDADHDVDHPDAGGPSPLSLKVMAVFTGIFGVVGVIVRANDGPHHWAILGGSGAGLVAASAAYGLILLLHRSQSSTDVSESSFVGSEATVVISIPEGGLGQVGVSHGVQSLTRIARSADGKPLAAGTVVRIERRAGEELIVRAV